MMKSSLLVIVFLAAIATVHSENDILDVLKKLLLPKPSGWDFDFDRQNCKWGKTDDYPSFDKGQEIEMLDGCYKCTWGDPTCDFKCQPNPAKKCKERKMDDGYVCQWNSAGLPYMAPREDVYKDDCHVCEFSVKNCEFMCWKMCSENASPQKKRLLTLLKDLTSN